MGNQLGEIKMTDDLAQLSEALRELTGSYRNEIAEDIQRRQAKESAEEKTRNMHDAGVKAGQAFVASLNSLTKSVLSTEAGMSKYNGAIGKAGDAAFALGSGFGVLGTVVGGLVKLFTMGAEAVLKQNDAMIKGYDALSEFGQTASLTSRDVLQLGKNAGYTSHNLEIFTKNAVKVSQEFAGLTGSASAGVVAFSKLTAITQEQRDQYNRLGQGQETVTKLQTDYVAQTVKAGIALAKTPAELQKNSLKYIDSLNELAAITGISVEKQQEALDIANANENFNAYKFSMDQKRLALDKEAEEATKAGLHEKAAELKAQSENIQQVIRSKDEAAKLAVATMSAANSAAYLQGISTDGATIYTEANAKLLRSGIDVAAQNEKMNKGGSALVDVLSSQVEAAKRFDANFGQAGYAMGEHSIELQKVFGMDNKARETAAKFAALTTDEEKKAFAEKIILTQKELADKKAGLGKVDDVKNAQNAQLATELKARQGLDGLVGVISGPVTNAFEKLMKVMTSVMKGMAIYSDKLFGTDLAKLFETPEEIADKVGKTALALEEVTRKIEQTKKAMQQPEAYREELIKEKKLTEDNYILKAQETEKTRELYSKEQDTAKKAILKQQLIENQKEEQAAKQLADQANLNIKNANFSMSKEKAEQKLLELEDQKLSLSKSKASGEEKLINKKIELGEKLNAEEQKQLQQKKEITLLEKERSGEKLSADEQIALDRIKLVKADEKRDVAAKSFRDSERGVVRPSEAAPAAPAPAAPAPAGKAPRYKTEQEYDKEITRFSKPKDTNLPDSRFNRSNNLALEPNARYIAKLQDERAALAGPAAKPTTSSPNQTTADGPADKPKISEAKSSGKAVDVQGLRNELSKSGISDRKSQANILAQIKGESDFIPRSEEIEKYSAKTIFDQYGGPAVKTNNSGKPINKKGNIVRFENIDEANALVEKGPEAVGEKIYGGRMGNTEPGEGYKYRGRGLIQITGKDNYKRFGKMIGVDLVKDPDLANDPDIAQKLAVAYFKEKGKNVDLTDISAVGKSVGFAGGEKEANKRALSAENFMKDLPQASQGGMFSGPKSGYPVELHGDEIVAPMELLKGIIKQELPSLETTGINSTSEGFQLPELSSIFEDFKKKFEQLSSAPVETVSSIQAPTTASSDNSINDFKQMTTEMIMVLTDKLDTVISKLGDGNDAREKILTYSMA